MIDVVPCSAWLCDRHDDIPVLSYGLCTDFQVKLFAGSAALLALADVLIEIKTVCHCGRKATMNLPMDESGRTVVKGAQTHIRGNDRYSALCRRHFMEQFDRASTDGGSELGADSLE